MTGYIQIVTTAGNEEQAEKIAKSLVENRLAACVQTVGPITSTYWWQGKIEKAQEWLCLIKSKTDLYEQVLSSAN